MKTRIRLALILGLALILPVLAVEDDWGNTSEYQKFFDRGSIVTIQGEVTGINRDTVPLPGMEPGFSVDVKTVEGENVNVQVGPLWFSNFYKRKWDVKVGDTVEVTGSKVKIDDKTVIMATKCVHRVQHNEASEMTLRSKQGVPVWDFDPDLDLKGL
jgi:hypothetical protein